MSLKLLWRNNPFIPSDIPEVYDEFPFSTLILNNGGFNSLGGGFNLVSLILLFTSQEKHIQIILNKPGDCVGSSFLWFFRTSETPENE